MLVVVSDLHLSEGRRRSSKKIAPAEDFFFDDEFSRFLAYLNSREPGGVHLVINGDLFDFLQVGVSARDLENINDFRSCSESERRYIFKYGAKTDEQSSVFKIDKIHAGHPVFFDALKEFLAAGNKLSIVSGNHDIELYWPGVQDRLKMILGVKNPALAADGGESLSVEFLPWFYYDRLYNAYVEHGHQYESLNSFRYLLYPVLPHDKRQLNLPFGSLFTRYLLTQAEEINPFADNIKPNTKYVAWAMKTDPLGFRRLVKLLWRFVVTIAKTFRRSGFRSTYNRSDIEAFEKETGRRLKDIAKRFDLPANTDDPSHIFQKIERLHRIPFNDGKFRLAWSLFFANLDILFFLISAASFIGFIFLAWRFGLRGTLSGVSLAMTVIGALAGQAYYETGLKMDKAMSASVRRISEILQGQAVKYIVFGHTHAPEIINLDVDKVYFNTGTWGVIFEEEEQLIRDKHQFAFLKFDHPGAEPKLLRWNDPLGGPELLPLFDKRKVV